MSMIKQGLTAKSASLLHVSPRSAYGVARSVGALRVKHGPQMGAHVREQPRSVACKAWHRKTKEEQDEWIENYMKEYDEMLWAEAPPTYIAVAVTMVFIFSLPWLTPFVASKFYHG